MRSERGKGRGLSRLEAEPVALALASAHGEVHGIGRVPRVPFECRLGFRLLPLLWLLESGLGGILSNEGVLGYDEGVWNDEGNRQRLLDMLKAHAAELRAWASDAGVRLPSAESAGELREQVRDLPQEPQIQEQPGYGYQPGFQQPQQWQQQPWN